MKMIEKNLWLDVLMNAFKGADGKNENHRAQVDVPPIEDLPLIEEWGDPEGSCVA